MYVCEGILYCACACMSVKVAVKVPLLFDWNYMYA